MQKMQLFTFKIATCEKFQMQKKTTLQESHIKLGNGLALHPPRPMSLKTTAKQPTCRAVKDLMTLVCSRKPWSLNSRNFKKFAVIGQTSYDCIVRAWLVARSDATQPLGTYC